jgi:putative oxidoreductase
MFLFPGRFAKIGIPSPQFTGPFVRGVEIVRGTMLIAGFLTAFATLPLLIDILVAITTTKLAVLPKRGFWATMHDGRTDFCMLLGLISIAMLGAGSLSLDARRKSDRWL